MKAIGLTGSLQQHWPSYCLQVFSSVSASLPLPHGNQKGELETAGDQEAPRGPVSRRILNMVHGSRLENPNTQVSGNPQVGHTRYVVCVSMDLWVGLCTYSCERLDAVLHACGRQCVFVLSLWSGSYGGSKFVLWNLSFCLELRVCHLRGLL